ncbi:hypothetical protein [Streptococcus sp. DD12]|uniref:hypothetical protein n=1 Tax=Streptococcus sp. DD12 TaxID=1777880 RepID=UPI00082A7B64|nr:hypothetical protein [Streptococcus sp. DD12]
MGKIKIKTNQLNMSTSSILTMERLQGASNGTDASVKDTSKVPLDDCLLLANQGASKISETVQKYSNFLTSLADAFKKQDEMLSEKFGFTPTIKHAKRKKTAKSDARQSDVYFK